MYFRKRQLDNEENSRVAVILANRLTDVLYRGRNSILMPDYLAETRYLERYFYLLVNAQNSADIFVDRFFEFVPNRFEPPLWLMRLVVDAIEYLGRYEELARLWQIIASLHKAYAPTSILNVITNIPQSMGEEGIFEKLAPTVEDIMEYRYNSIHNPVSVQELMHGGVAMLLAKRPKKARQYLKRLDVSAASEDRPLVLFELSKDDFDIFQTLVRLLTEEQLASEAIKLIRLAQRNVPESDLLTINGPLAKLMPDLRKNASEEEAEFLDSLSS